MPIAAPVIADKASRPAHIPAMRSDQNAPMCIARNIDAWTQMR